MRPLTNQEEQLLIDNGIDFKRLEKLTPAQLDNFLIWLSKKPTNKNNSAFVFIGLGAALLLVYIATK